MLCERSCPDEAIKIESEKRADGPGRVLTKFTIDLGQVHVLRAVCRAVLDRRPASHR